jgi:hypothetical protein
MKSLFVWHKFHKMPECQGGKCFPLTTVVDLMVDSNKNLLPETKGKGAWRVITGP